jgi:hypothetical protein
MAWSSRKVSHVARECFGSVCGKSREDDKIVSQFTDEAQVDNMVHVNGDRDYYSRGMQDYKHGSDEKQQVSSPTKEAWKKPLCHR